MNTAIIHRLRVSAPVAEKLQAYHLAHGKNVEAISMINGHGYVGSDGAVTVVIAKPEQVILFEKGDYLRQAFAAAQLPRTLRGEVYFRGLQESYTASVDAHDHHMVHAAQHSGTDDADDASTARYFQTTIPNFWPMGPQGLRLPVVAASLVLAKSEWAARVVHAPGFDLLGAPMRIDVVGAKFTVRSRLRHFEASAHHVRQAPILSERGQACLSQLHGVVVGTGGTGSIAAEMLARMGVRRITLVDQDKLELSNLNRLQGLGPSDEGHLKVEALRAHLARCCPGVQVNTIAEPIWAERAVAAAESADFLVGCVDNNESRWFINRISVQHMLPYWDVGVRAKPDEQEFGARCTAVIPGAGPCGHCSPIEYFDRKRPATFLDATTLAAQRQAGYLLNNTAMTSDPSLYALNMQAVAQFGQEFTRWLSPGGVMAHSHFQLNHGSGQTTVQRLGMDAVAKEPDPDCPVCGSLLGACRSQLLPQLNPPAPQLSLSDFLNH